MKRTIMFGLVCLTIAGFVRTAAADTVTGNTGTASDTEVPPREADGQRPATLHEIRSLLRDLADVSAELGVVSVSMDNAAQPAEAVVRSVIGGNDDWRYDECRFQSLNDPLWTANEERLTAECAVDRWSVPGGLSEFLAIGQCESGWSRFSYNPNGPYVGIFQHAGSAYVSRINQYNPPSWDHPLSTRWKNSRGQIVMSARMMHAVGLSPWSCA